MASCLHFKLPSSFTLPDVREIAENVFQYGLNPHLNETIKNKTIEWFKSYNVCAVDKAEKFAKQGDFALLAAYSFPRASAGHLEICIKFFLWAFAVDDCSDEGDMQRRPEDFKAEVQLYMQVLLNPSTCIVQPKTYASMLQEIAICMRQTASEATMNRFAAAVYAWGISQAEQSFNRSVDQLPTTDDFIAMRRDTFGNYMARVMLEYALEVTLSDSIAANPVFTNCLDQLFDLTIWSNDLCSFNKEQATGDFHNLVCIIMHERHLSVQSAINTIIDMLQQRLSEYLDTKCRLESDFNIVMTNELTKYVEAAEMFAQGMIVWYYHCPRYFQDIDAWNKGDLLITLSDKKIE